MQLLRIETPLGEIVAYEIFGKRYFKAVEMASLLGYTKPREAVNRYCETTEFMDIPTNGGWQSTKMILGDDIYRLAMHCPSDICKAIREDWISDLKKIPGLYGELNRLQDKNIALLKQQIEACKGFADLHKSLCDFWEILKAQ